MSQFICLTLVAVLTGAVSMTSAFKCYTCSYTITSLPMYSFECANDTDHVKTGSPMFPCADSLYCVTKVVYYADLSAIKSISRQCQVPDRLRCGVNCCDKSLYDVSCQYECQSDACNNRDVTSMLKRPTGTAATILPGNTLLFMFACFYSVVLYLT